MPEVLVPSLGFSLMNFHPLISMRSFSDNLETATDFAEFAAAGLGLGLLGLG